MAGFNKYGPGKCCGCASPNCSTTVTVNFRNLQGGTDLSCGGPRTILYEVTGTATNGTSISLSGSVSNPGASFSRNFPSSQLPEGSYSVHVYEREAICGQPVGPTGRFDGTKNFTVVCPSTVVALTLQATFDLVVSSSKLAILRCDPGASDTIALSVSATISGPATLCLQETATSGNLALTLKATGYPFSVRFDGTAPGCLSADETWTHTNCSDRDSDYRVGESGTLVATKFAIQVLDQATGLGRPGATVAATGRMTGSGTTAGSAGKGYLTVSAYKQAKKTTPLADLKQTWLLSAPNCNNRTYYTDYQGPVTIQDEPQNPDIRGTTCPLGGYLSCYGGPPPTTPTGPSNPGGTQAMAQAMPPSASQSLAPSPETREALPPGPDPISVWALVETCPFASGYCGCDGSPPRDCSRPDRPGKVMKDQCYFCQAGTWTTFDLGSLR